MQFDIQENQIQDEFESGIQLRQELEKYTSKWKLFLVSILVFLILGFLVIRYQAPEYKVYATLLIKEPEQGKSFSELSSFEDLGLFSTNNKNLENEIQILSSRKLMTRVVKELKLNFTYLVESSPIDKEYYPNFPVELKSINGFDQFEYVSAEILINIKNSKSFEIFDVEGESMGIKNFSEEFRYNFGDSENGDGKLISISLNENFGAEDFIDEDLTITISPIHATVNNYLNKLKIEPINQMESEVIQISIKDHKILKGKSLINNLIEQYNADGIEEKNKVTKYTTDFLNDRLTLIGAELTAIESTVEKFKTRNKVVDVNSNANFILQSSSENESEVVATNTQLQLISFMLDELGRTDLKTTLPGNIGIENTLIINLIEEYNALISQRNRVLKSSSEINPIVVNIDSEIQVLRNGLINSLENERAGAQIKLQSLYNQGSKIINRMASVPKNEREYKDIVRQQEIKRGLYLFLLQKKEESILSNAVNTDKSKVIDEAYSNGFAVSPNKGLIYFGSFFMGFLVPFLFIYFSDLIDTKVHSEKDLRKLGIPYLGDIPFEKELSNQIFTENDSTPVPEAIRYIRTNLNFMLREDCECKTILMTSTQSHEGKTFCAINLATSLAISGKKTLLLAFDLRAPKFSHYFDSMDKTGITNYIKDSNLTVFDITQSYEDNPKLDFIASGDIPPNPAELMMHDRTDQLFETIKSQYEYIIIDSSPIGMVTDSIYLGKYANATIYVVRSNFLDKRLLHIPNKMNSENKLPNMAMLLNGTIHSSDSYGYGYGYGST